MPFRHGSSPLTRGKLDIVPEVAAVVRLIPAHAGKTVGAGLRLVLDRAHPRSRGENRPKDDAGIQGAGSSPLTRGKHVAAAARPARTRLIPAHAGKTRGAAGLRMSQGAHPRSRGENFVCRNWCWIVLGSSPLTRGKLSIM